MTSTSWVGPSLTAALQSPKVAYLDPSGTVYISVTPEAVWVWADIIGERTLHNFRHWRDVFDAFDHELTSKGVECYYTVVSDVNRYRFAKHFGFKSTGLSFNNILEVMWKDLTV